MRLHGLRADLELGGHLLGGEAFRDQVKHLALATR